ncbi:hypothetical protein ZIOFF_022911 [Zingiber officinale]|uniref:Uncharacterized protein n=1 Tax=Zingiber officinale TaxID=94328 RepID=A0A8J5H3K6_ZINOF|nr:hypothetical protein ZIOFF_022911 [Zingiber officinale]
MIEGRFVNDQAMNQPMSKKRRGGWLSAILLLLNQGLATIGFVGVEVNLVLFCTRVLRQSNADAANTFSRWMGTVHLFSLAGAFLSDAYLGRYYTCALFQPVLVIGLVALSLTTSFLLLKPRDCGTMDFFCHQPSTFEYAMFYLSIYLIALGSGAYEPSLATFGSDQLDDHGDDDEENPNISSKQQSFYSYFYVATNLGSLVAETIIAYIENTGQWTLGFYISAACAVLAIALFFLGRTRYRFVQLSGPNPLSSFCQVVVASCNKAKIALPVENGLLYDGPEERQKPKSTAALPAKDFRFLDHAAIVTEEDAVAPNPWRLCTVAQVEDVKCVLRVVPIWLCTLTFAGVFVQMVSLFVEQGAAMDTALPGGFHIPPASLTAFDILVVSFFIVSYDKLSWMLDKLNTPVFPPNFDLWKMGAGLVVAMAGMVLAGILERERRDRGEGHQQSSLFILWQVPQYVLIGTGEALVYVGQYDFFSSQVPEALKSVGIGLSMASVAVGSYVCSLVLTVVMAVTTRGGRVGWVPPDLNQGRLDAFFFLMAGLTAVELDPEGILGPPQRGHIARLEFRKQLEKDAVTREAFNRQLREEREQRRRRRESRVVPETIDGLIEYFLDTEAREIEVEIARLNKEFFDHLQTELGQLRFAINRTKEIEDRTIELEAMQKVLLEGTEAYDKMQMDFVSARERLMKILQAKDRKSAILELVEKNELNRSVLALLDENIASAQASNQKEAADFMESVRATVVKYITL